MAAHSAAPMALVVSHPTFREIYDSLTRASFRWREVTFEVAAIACLFESRRECREENTIRNRKIISPRIDMSEAMVTADTCLKELRNKVSEKRYS